MTRSPGRFAIWFVFATVLIDMIGIGLVMPVLPHLIEAVSGRGLAGASLLGGWLFFVYGAMQFLFGPVIGNLSDAYGRRPVLLLSVAGLGIDYILTGLAPNMAWLFVGRAIAGLCGASYITANAYLADVTAPEDRAKAFGMVGAAFGLGFVVGPALGGLLGQWGPRVPFFAAAAFSIANFLFGMFVLPETLPPEKRRPFALARANPLGTLKVFAKYPGMIAMALTMFAYFAASTVYPAIWAFWGIARFGWSELTIGLTLAAFGLTTAIFQGLLTGPIVNRIGERGAVILGLAIGTMVPIGYGLAPSLAVVLALLVVHAPEGLVHPAMTALMSHRAPSDAQGELQGGIASLQSLGMVVGTLFYAELFGWFMAGDGSRAAPNGAFFVAAALIGLSALGVLAWTREEPPTPP